MQLARRTRYGKRPLPVEPGSLTPVRNPYSWSNLTNVMWVEQPLGVGFTQGIPNINDEVELAVQFRGLFKSFVDTFDMHGWQVYLTGESYAGFYIPYIAQGFIQANDVSYFNLKGIAINDPRIGDETNQRRGKDVDCCEERG
jgi:carboxypeptidase D